MTSILIGMTGGPGGGKSEAGRIFGTFPDWQCFDTDLLCGEIYAQSDSPILKLLEERWGGAVRGADGRPDKSMIAEKIFGDATERRWLNSILHPEILSRLETAAARSRAKFVLAEAPLLFESGWDRRMAKTIAVWTPPEIQLARLLQRGWSKKQAGQRIATQFSMEKKLELADYGIINRGALDALRLQCRRLDKAIKTAFA